MLAFLNPPSLRADAREQGSRAYVRAIQKIGIVSEEECAQIIGGLEAIEKEWAAGAFELKPGDEVQVVIERDGEEQVKFLKMKAAG